MRSISSCIAVAAIISIVCAAPTTDKIKAAVAQLECTSETILQFDKKHGMGNLWLPAYFPLVMQTSAVYECEAHKQSDRCVDEEMRSIANTLVNLFAVRENDSIALAELQVPIVNECGIELSQFDGSDGFDGLDGFDVERFNFKKHIDIKKSIEHIKCVVTAMAIAIGDNPDALDWIRYQLQLTKSIAKLVVCTKLYAGFAEGVCIATELRTTIRVLVDYWKFLSEKKHLEVLAQIKAEIKDKCYTKPF